MESRSSLANEAVVKFMDVLVPQATWKDIPRIHALVANQSPEGACHFVDVIMRSLLVRSNQTLEQLVFELCIQLIGSGIPFLGLVLIEAGATGLLEVSPQDDARTRDVTTRIIAQLLEGSADPTRIREALYVKHVLELGDYDEPRSSEDLREAARLGQCFAMHDLAEVFFNQEADVLSYVNWASRAMRAGHRTAALQLIERITGNHDMLANHGWLAMEAARELAVRGSTAGMVDLALQSAESRYCMFLAAAEGDQQALRILGTDDRFSESFAARLAVKDLVSSPEQELAATALRQEAACLLIERLLSKQTQRT